MYSPIRLAGFTTHHKTNVLLLKYVTTTISVAGVVKTVVHRCARVRARRNKVFVQTEWMGDSPRNLAT